MRAHLIELWFCDNCNRSYDVKVDADLCCLCQLDDCRREIYDIDLIDHVNSDPRMRIYCEKHYLEARVKDQQIQLDNDKKMLVITQNDYKKYMRNEQRFNPGVIMIRSFAARRNHLIMLQMSRCGSNDKAFAFYFALLNPTN